MNNTSPLDVWLSTHFVKETFHMADISEYLAIDPLALILSNAAYVRLTLPDPAPDEVIFAQMKQVAAQLKGNERNQALAKARVLGAYARGLEKALSSRTAKGRK
jgi:hypothetical protein